MDPLSTHNICFGKEIRKITFCYSYLWAWGGIRKSVPRIMDWHHDACRVMTNGDHEGQIFYPTLTRIMDSFSCSPLNTAVYVLKMFPEIPEFLLEATCHDDVILT